MQLKLERFILAQMSVLYFEDDFAKALKSRGNYM